MLKKLLASATSLSLTDPSQFPAFDSGHSHCELTMTVNKACSEVWNQVNEIVEDNKDPASPPGTYKPYEKEKNEYVWATRLTANKKYVDDVIFELADADGNCMVHSRSRSQSDSLYDNNVNFCNQFNVMKQVYPAIEGDAGKANYKVGECLLNQSDFTACGRY